MDAEKIREAIDEIQNVKWLIDECPPNTKLIEAQDRLTKLKSALSTIDPEAIRRECAEAGKAWYLEKQFWDEHPSLRLQRADELYYRILSAEPAQDDGKARVGE